MSFHICGHCGTLEPSPSLTVSEIFNVEYGNAMMHMVDVTLIRPLNEGQGHSFWYQSISHNTTSHCGLRRLTTAALGSTIGLYSIFRPAFGSFRYLSVSFGVLRYPSVITTTDLILHTRNVGKAQNYNSSKFRLKMLLKIRSMIFSTKQLHLLILGTFQDSAKWVFSKTGFGKKGLNPVHRSHVL